MRNAPNKKRGYVILPVVIPTGMEPHEALNDNKTYKVVWEVLNALRSHDDRFDAHINKLELIGKDNQKMEVIAITDKVGKKNRKNSTDEETGKGDYDIGKPEKTFTPVEFDLKFEVGEIERALYAKIVQKCGNRHHWEDWAADIAKIAQTHITRIRAILDTPENTQEIAAFTAFAGELRDGALDIRPALGERVLYPLRRKLVEALGERLDEARQIAGEAGELVGHDRHKDHQRQDEQQDGQDDDQQRSS